jgi:MFS family permease
MFSLTMVMIPEVVSPGKMGLTSGLIGMTLGCSGVLGPILGGVISHFTTWRWIFFIKYVPTLLAAIDN